MRDVMRVARQGDPSQAEGATDLDISVESVRRWVRQADIRDGDVEGQTLSERTEFPQLRRRMRRLDMRNGVLRGVAACFARGTRRVLQVVTRPAPG